MMVKTVKNENIFHGRGSLKNLLDIMEDECAHNLLLISGKKSSKSTGLKSQLDALLKDKNSILVNDFEVNPKYEEILKIGGELKQKKFDLFIAEGGGSVIDFAKCMNVFLSSWTEDGEDGIHDKKFLPNKLLPMVAIPTTSGTGSEATHFAVVYIDGIKVSIAHKSLVPKYAIIDPSFTYNSPPYLTACCGFDALCQAIESYWAINATEESKQYAKQAIRLIKQNIINAIKNDCYKSRDKLSEGSFLAGKAINISKTSAPHALSYSLTSKFNIPHGHAVALTLGHFFEINEDNTFQQHISSKINLDLLKKNLQEIKHYLGWKDKQSFKYEWTTFMHECGLKPTIQNISSSENLINDLTESVNAERLTNHPVIISKKMISNIYRNLFV